MFEVMYRLVEMMALVLCLHNLSGEKVKLDIYNLGFISIELTFMQMIQDEIVSKQMYFVAYLIYFVYVYIKFNDTIKRTILKCVLATMIIVSLQMIIDIPAYLLSTVIGSEAIGVLIINSFVLLILIITRKSEKYESVVEFCTSKDWVIRICILVCTGIIIYCMYSLKKNYVVEIDIFILVSLFMIIFLIFIYRWQKSIYELKRKEQEIQIANLYNHAFGDLIDTIRRRQHDFNNQIEAIYSTHMTTNSLEELVEAQKAFCDNVTYESRYSKVLSCINDSTLAGFIYSKFNKAEQCGIEIEYDIVYTGNTSISIYDLVEIIGIFMDNAVEALMESKLEQKIIFQLKDYDGFKFTIKNPVSGISNNDIAKFFENGYTTKTEGSGIGLSKIMDYQKKYECEIYTQITEEHGHEWIEFQIIEKM